MPIPALAVECPPLWRRMVPLLEYAFS